MNVITSGSVSLLCKLMQIYVNKCKSSISNYKIGEILHQIKWFAYAFCQFLFPVEMVLHFNETATLKFSWYCKNTGEYVCRTCACDIKLISNQCVRWRFYVGTTLF